MPDPVKMLPGQVGGGSDEMGPFQTSDAWLALVSLVVIAVAFGVAIVRKPAPTMVRPSPAPVTSASASAASPRAEGAAAPAGTLPAETPAAASTNGAANPPPKR